MSIAQDILKAEFIGREIEILESKNSSLKGIKGKIIDETKSTFTISTEIKNDSETEKKENKQSKKIIVMKNVITFKTKFNGKSYKIDGKLLAKRPHERIKSKMK